MKKRQEIKYINKKFLKKVVAGAMGIILLTTPLVGCASIEDIKYSTNDQGYIENIEGNVSYDFLYWCAFFKVKNNITNEEYYTIGLVESDTYDVFTKQNLSSDVFVTEYICRVEDYLVAFNMMKAEYTEEELKDILGKFVETQEKVNVKQKVKE